MDHFVLHVIFIGNNRNILLRQYAGGPFQAAAKIRTAAVSRCDGHFIGSYAGRLQAYLFGVHMVHVPCMSFLHHSRHLYLFQGRYNYTIVRVPDGDPERYVAIHSGTVLPFVAYVRVAAGLPGKDP